MILSDEEFEMTKRILQGLFRAKPDVGDEPGLYVRTIRPSDWDREDVDPYEGPLYQLLITDTELRERIDGLSDWKRSDELEIVSSHYYERAVLMERYGSLFRRYVDAGGESSIVTYDANNQITYRINELPSPEYCLTLVTRSARNNAGSKDVSIRRIPPLFHHRIAADLQPTFDDFLGRCIATPTVSIQSEKELAPSKLQDLANSYIFTTMYRTGCAIGEYQEIGQILGIRNRQLSVANRADFETPPARFYDRDAIDYYSVGLMSRDPYIAYISFYHVLEFYFDSVFRAEVSKKLRAMITKPGFSYTRESDVFNIAKAIAKEMRMTRKRGYGNEQSELEYVIRRFVVLDEMKSRLEEVEPSSVNRYGRQKCEFSRKTTIINWENKDGAIKAMVKRVYETRNALIHSKNLEDESIYRYRPYKDEDKLRLELPLIRVLAEQVLIGSSRMLDT